VRKKSKRTTSNNGNVVDDDEEWSTRNWKDEFYDCCCGEWQQKNERKLLKHPRSDNGQTPTHRHIAWMAFAYSVSLG
jgi:hypothetical protein